MAPESLAYLLASIALVAPFAGLIAFVLLWERLGTVRAAALVLSLLIVLYGVVWPWL